jgi:hypothetical protein
MNNDTTETVKVSDLSALRILVMLGAQHIREDDDQMSKDLVAFAEDWLRTTPMF